MSLAAASEINSSCGLRACTLSRSSHLRLTLPLSRLDPAPAQALQSMGSLECMNTGVHALPQGNLSKLGIEPTSPVSPALAAGILYL